MIFGECPYCDKPVTNSMPERSPAYFESKCEHCGETYWLYATRLGECTAYTQDGFNEEFVVDRENKTIERRKTD